MKIMIPDPVDQILRRLQDAGYEAYAVGGCIRDSMLGYVPNDWDVATSAAPAEMKSVFAGTRVLEIGMRHGTLTVLTERMPVEVTSYRVDGSYSDNRHPDCVRFTRSLREDLARRDFTINAIAYRPETGPIDPFGGIGDLRAGVVRCVGDPEERFREDGLRILRALRFASVLGFMVESATSEQIFRQAHRLDGISRERIREEFLKLLCGKNAVPVLREYRKVIARFLPEIGAADGLPQHSPQRIRYGWEHTLRALSASEPDPLPRMILLLHGIGGTSRSSPDSGGIGHSPNDMENAEWPERLLRRLRFDHQSIDRIVSLVQCFDADLPVRESDMLRQLSRLGERDFRVLLRVKMADTAAQELARADGERAQLRETELLLNRILARGLCYSLKDLKVDGRDLIALGIPQGKEIGRILSLLLEEVMDGTCPNERQALLSRAKREKGAKK